MSADQAAERLRRWVTRDVSPMPLDVDILAVCDDRDRFAATVQQVRALADEADATAVGSIEECVPTSDLRAALAATPPAGQGGDDRD